MFEKEAEEYREKEKDKGYYWVTQEMEQSELDTIVDESFKDGAVFGYNKCFEQIRKIVNEGTRLDCIIPELLRLKELENV